MGHRPRRLGLWSYVISIASSPEAAASRVRWRRVDTRRLLATCEAWGRPSFLLWHFDPMVRLDMVLSRGLELLWMAPISKQRLGDLCLFSVRSVPPARSLPSF